MLRVVVTDITAAERLKLSEKINSYLATCHDSAILPRVTLQQLAAEELRFHAQPDVCIVGGGLLANNLRVIADIKTHYNTSALIVELTQQIDTIETVSYLARAGVNDTINARTTADDFIRKLILLAQRSHNKTGASLILVDSGKGGVGATSVAAGLGAAIAIQDKRTLLIDLDFETQDLTRFLQVKPFVNESLAAILERQTPLGEESALQSCAQVWQDFDQLKVVAPVADGERLNDTAQVRQFIATLEVLDNSFDAIIVDCAGITGPLRRTLFRLADKIVFVVNNDPAALFASVARAQKSCSLAAPDTELIFVNNAPNKFGLSPEQVVGEFTAILKIPQDAFVRTPINFCKSALRWPGSGETIYQHAQSVVVKVYDQLAAKLGFAAMLPPRTLPASQPLEEIAPPIKPKQLPQPSLELNSAELLFQRPTFAPEG